MAGPKTYRRASAASFAKPHGTRVRVPPYADRYFCSRRRAVQGWTRVRKGERVLLGPTQRSTPSPCGVLHNGHTAYRCDLPRWVPGWRLACSVMQPSVLTSCSVSTDHTDAEFVFDWAMKNCLRGTDTVLLIHVDNPKAPRFMAVPPVGGNIVPGIDGASLHQSLAAFSIKAEQDVSHDLPS